MRRIAITLFTLVAAVLLAAPPAAVADSTGDVALHIRTTDRRLARLLHQGIRDSARFRTLVARLVRSDVIVYLQCEGYATHGGRLTFMGSGAGYRYVRVRVGRVVSAGQQIALLGHELQHAVEIADEPDIVDAASMATQYRRFGHVAETRADMTAYDSNAAVEAGYQILRELQISD